MKMRFWPGETVRVRVDFTDDAEVPMAATGVVIVARPPAPAALITGTVIPVIGVVGAFEADFGANIPGRWGVRATCAGPTGAAVEDEFTIASSLVLEP